MTFRILTLKNTPIYQQLLLEEKLLRLGTDNWCIINEGSTPAIVMGISGKKEELVDPGKAQKNNLPIIKRFSGGGTVVVDQDTLFVTFICNRSLHTFAPYPEPIMKWSEEIYKDVFTRSDFRLRENDYVFGEKKFGGNAQYIKKDRWLHHTSFLWNYSKENMTALLHPKKSPAYREGRSHEEFLCTLSDYYLEKEELIKKLIETLENRYGIKEISSEHPFVEGDEAVRISTQWINWE